jgi:hypothetical protein
MVPNLDRRQTSESFLPCSSASGGLTPFLLLLHLVRIHYIKKMDATGVLKLLLPEVVPNLQPTDRILRREVARIQHSRAKAKLRHSRMTNMPLQVSDARSTMMCAGSIWSWTRAPREKLRFDMSIIPRSFDWVLYLVLTRDLIL